MPMPIDIETEELVHFVEAPKCFPGRKPCLQSLHRWRLHGVTGRERPKGEVRDDQGFWTSIHLASRDPTIHRRSECGGTERTGYHAITTSTAV